MYLNIFPSLYLVIASIHFSIQFITAWAYRKRYRSRPLPKGKLRVAVVIPGYREEYQSIINTINSCIKSIQQLPHAGAYCRIIYIEDDCWSFKVTQLQQQYRNTPQVLVTATGINKGKREAQAEGLNTLYRSSYYPDYVLTVDSDTCLHPQAITSLLTQFRRSVGAVTGNVSISNKDNWLQRIVSLRYFLAFNQERASQSFFGEVLCCSGPLTIYRADLLYKLLPDYLNQTFRGVKCTFGDDRHLTSLVLREGYRTVYDYKAICWTSCPDTLRTYLKQQARWCRSWCRENYLMYREDVVFNRYRGILWFSLWESAATLALPILLTINVVYMLAQHAFHPEVLARYLLVICIVAWVRSIAGVAWDSLNDRKDYILFPLFALINFIVLIPLRVYAVGTITTTQWGTRSLRLPICDKGNSDESPL